MNEREIAEIRRRMRPDKNNIGRIRGCYVSENKSIISEFNQNLGMISMDESEELLSHLRRIFSGTIGRNLIDVSFSNQQVLDSEEHILLSKLRDSSLSDDNSVRAFFEKTISSLEIDGSYMILLANDKYDVFSKEDENSQEDSSRMFSYIVCAICPVKTAKSHLSYSISEKKFKNILRDSIINAPALGFMFPAFDSRCANIYEALFYTHDISQGHNEFTKRIFCTDMPKPAAEQTESIANIIENTIAENCDIGLVQAIQGQLIELATDHKNNKEDEPLLLSNSDVNTLLRFGGVDEKTATTFTEKIKEEFGNDTQIPPTNVLDTKKFEVKSDEITLRLKPEYSDLVSTRVIDGTKYIMIRADNDAVVNGIKITIK